MAEVTVAQFADVLKVPVEKLITQLDEAGIKVSGSDDTISEDAKLELLTHLRQGMPRRAASHYGANRSRSSGWPARRDEPVRSTSRFDASAPI
jgi:hypothetical protein